MAVFNPNVPDMQDPNYLNYSKPISDIPADKTWGAAFETAGKGIEAVVNVADTIVRKDIDSKVQEGVDKERDAYTQALERIRGEQGGSVIPSGNTDGQDLVGPVKNAPVPLQSSLQSIESLGVARANGKINDTYYTQQLNSMVKNIRAQYPGYRDYIDQKVAQVSGINPANEYYKNLMADINRDATAAGDERKQIQGMIRQNMELPNMDNIAKLYDANRLDKYDVMGYINKYQSFNYNMKLLQTQREAQKGTREEVSTTARRDFAVESSGYVENAFTTLQLGTGTQTIEGAIKFLDDMAQNPGSADPVQIQNVVTALSSKRDQLALFLKKRAAQLDSTGQSYVSRMGGNQAVDDEIKGALASFDYYIKTINNKEFGVGTAVSRFVTATSDANKRSLLRDPNVGNFTQKLQALSDLAPAFSDVIAKSGLIQNVDKQYKGWMEEANLDALTQPDFLTKGKPTTINSLVQDARDKKVPESSRVYNELFNIPKTIADPNLNLDDEKNRTVVKNAAIAAFHPDNLGILDKIKKDYVDPATGKFVPGKYSVFSRMTSSDITDRMWQLRNKDGDGPLLWNNYKDWSSVEFGKLFRSDVSTLGNVTDKESRLKFYWDGDNKRIGLLNDKGTPLVTIGNMAVSPSIKQAMSTVNRINSGLHSLKNIAEKEGSNVEFYLLQQLSQYGLELNENTKGIPEAIRQAIISSNKKNIDSFEKTFSDREKK